MNIQLRVLPFVALLNSTGSAFATFDPFDPELFLSPYGEVVTSIITTEVVGAGTSDAGMIESPIVELMSHSSPQERVLDDRQAETGALDGPAIELALQANNFIHDEAGPPSLPQISLRFRRRPDPSNSLSQRKCYASKVTRIANTGARLRGRLHAGQRPPLCRRDDVARFESTWTQARFARCRVS